MSFTQQISGKFRAFAGFIAVFLLVIFLSAKIPSSHCHCQDPVKSKKEACPFSALRTLTFVPTVVTPLVILTLTASLPPAYFTQLFRILVTSSIGVKARAPPELLEQ